jgi:glutamyl-tRNA synthetase
MKALNMSRGDLPEIFVNDFRANGYLPAVLLNFLALLGWSPGGDKERMTVDEMVQLFSLDQIGKSNAKFNREKLLAFSTEAFTAAGPKGLLPAMRDYLSVNPDSPLNGADDEQLENVLHMNAGFHILREADEKSGFLFLADDQVQLRPEAVEKVLRKDNGAGLSALVAIRPVLAAVAEWNAHALEEAINAHCTATGAKLGKVAQPIRVAVSGSTISPPIFQTLEFLGRERSLRRIDRTIESVQAAGHS